MVNRGIEGPLLRRWKKHQDERAELLTGLQGTEGPRKLGEGRFLSLGSLMVIDGGILWVTTMLRVTMKGSNSRM